MCNLYSLTPKEDDVGRFLRVSHNGRAAFKPVNAIFPRHVAPVVRRSDDGEREIVLMSWAVFAPGEERAPNPVTFRQMLATCALCQSIRSRPIVRSTNTSTSRTARSGST